MKAKLAILLTATLALVTLVLPAALTGASPQPQTSAGSAAAAVELTPPPPAADGQAQHIALGNGRHLMQERAYSESATLANGTCRQALPAACDGRAGLAIGVPNDDVSGAPNAGAINILYGSNRGLRDYRSQAWNQESPGVFGFSEENDSFGRSLAAGDFDGDDFTDLAVGSPWEAIGGSAMPDRCAFCAAP